MAHGQGHACNCPHVRHQEEMETRFRSIHSQNMFDLLQQGASSVMSGGHDHKERLPIEAACNLNIDFNNSVELRSGCQVSQSPS
jgi:hypothetical protein